VVLRSGELLRLSLGQRGSLVRPRDVVGVKASSHNLRALKAMEKEGFMHRFK